MHLYDDRIVHSVVPIPEAEEMVGYPLELAAQAEKLSPEELRELLSNKDSPLWAHENPLE
jgi:hypothetical protein